LMDDGPTAYFCENCAFFLCNYKNFCENFS